MLTPDLRPCSSLRTPHRSYWPADGFAAAGNPPLKTPPSPCTLVEALQNYSLYTPRPNPLPDAPAASIHQKRQTPQKNLSAPPNYPDSPYSLSSSPETPLPQIPQLLNMPQK